MMAARDGKVQALGARSVVVTWPVYGLAGATQVINGAVRVPIAHFLAALVPLAGLWAVLQTIVGVALIGTSGQFCLNQAFRYGQASLIAPFDYTGLVWATLLGAFIWGDYPNALMLAGAAIVIACCLYILRAGARGRADAPMEP